MFVILKKMEEVMKSPEKEFTSISEIEPIEQSGAVTLTRETIKEVVEAPLVAACTMLYDKNIRTVMSSANKKDIERGEAYILIEYDSLSEENKMIAKGFAEPEEIEGRHYVHIPIPVSSKSTIYEVHTHACSIAEGFKKQKNSWLESYTLDEMRGMFASASLSLDEIKSIPDIFYDQHNEKFYLNEEHYLKVMDGNDLPNYTTK